MINFQFEYNKKGYEFCLEIADKMVELFNITYEEAVDRINSQWHDIPLIDDDDIVYHDDAEQWANVIYYREDSGWYDPELKEKLHPKVYNAKTNEYE